MNQSLKDRLVPLLPPFVYPDDLVEVFNHETGKYLLGILVSGAGVLIDEADNKTVRSEFSEIDARRWALNTIKLWRWEQDKPHIENPMLLP